VKNIKTCLMFRDVIVLFSAAVLTSIRVSFIEMCFRLFPERCCAVLRTQKLGPDQTGYRGRDRETAVLPGFLAPENGH
jgi:hypothetical protein